MSRRTTLLTAVLGWLWAIVALEPCTNSGWGFGWPILLPPTGLIIGVLWVRATFAPQGRNESNWLRWLCLFIPVAWFAVLLLNATDWGLALRIRRCEEELRDFAIAVQQGEQKVEFTSSGKRIGTICIQDTSSIGSEVSMITVRGFLDSYGITYCPNGDLVASGKYRHLYGPWYRYYDHF